MHWSWTLIPNTWLYEIYLVQWDISVVRKVLINFNMFVPASICLVVLRWLCKTYTSWNFICSGWAFDSRSWKQPQWTCETTDSPAYKIKGIYMCTLTGGLRSSCENTINFMTFFVITSSPHSFAGPSIRSRPLFFM